MEDSYFREILKGPSDLTLNLSNHRRFSNLWKNIVNPLITVDSTHS